MALCDQGYLCDVCGQEVETIEDSDLYLRYILGEIDPETLHSSRERHLRCNPTLAPFVFADGFVPVVVQGYFDKRQLDPEFVAGDEARVTRGYLRLIEIPSLNLSILEYPLPEVQARWRDARRDSPDAPPPADPPPPGSKFSPVQGPKPSPML